MSLTLYLHPLASFCHKVLIALYENGTPFESSLVDFFDPGAAAAHIERWPVGKIPVLHDSATGRIVPETSIVIEYLQQHYPGPVRLLPEAAGLQLDTRLWDRFFDLYVSVPMQKIVGDRIRPEGATDPHGVAEAHATLETAYGMIESQLRDRTWIAGESFTMADCSALPALFFATIVHPAGHGRPLLHAYFERLLARPSTRRVLSEAQPYFRFFPYREDMPARFPGANGMTGQDDLGRLFEMMADPYRRGFVERLCKGPASVKELAAPAAVQLPAVLKHLKVLEEGGIVVSRKTGRTRTFRIRRDAFVALSAWIDQRQREMNAAFDRLAELMAEIPEEDH